MQCPSTSTHCYSFRRPRKDDRLSQPPAVLIQRPTGLELRTPGPQAATIITKPTPGSNDELDITKKISYDGVHDTHRPTWDRVQSSEGWMECVLRISEVMEPHIEEVNMSPFYRQISRWGLGVWGTIQGCLPSSRLLNQPFLLNGFEWSACLSAWGTCWTLYTKLSNWTHLEKCFIFIVTFLRTGKLQINYTFGVQVWRHQ